jgi:putative ABC transport system ATP-binding protein
MSSPSAGTIVQANNLSKQVQSPEGQLTILDQVTLQIEQGQTAAIVGSSGSGKSTLLSLLAGLDVPTGGSVELLGKNLQSMDEDSRASLRAGNVGFVFQSFQLLQNMTAIENVMLPLELSGTKDAYSQAEQILDRVGLEHRHKHYPNQLSGGEQQRVALARAYSSSPKILFADEPTGNLDQATAQQIIDLLFTLNKDQGTTLVLVTHDPKISEHCNNQFKLDRGRLID